MHVAKYWRTNARRYRLEGVAYENGQKSLMQREAQTADANTNTTVVNKADEVIVVEATKHVAA